MSIAYFDTSALVKHYIDEPGSIWVNSYLSGSPSPLILSSVLTSVESSCAFARRLREGNLSVEMHARLLSAFDYDITHKYQLLDVISTTVEAARELAYRHPLRAYDALQLATALLVNNEIVREDLPPLLFVTADDRLLRIAQIENLPTENPNQYS